MFHPLFSDFLLHRLELSCHSTALAELQIRAAQILEHNGYREAAVNLYCSAEEWGSVVRVIVEDAGKKFRQGRIQSLGAQVKGLPADVVMHNSWLRHWLGMCQMFLEPKKAHANFAVAFEQFKEKQDNEGAIWAWAGAVNSLMTEWEDVAKIDEWIVIGERLMPSQDLTITTKVNPHATSAMCFALFLCRPHSPLLKSYIQSTHALVIASRDLTFSLMGCNLLLIFYGWQGDLAKAGLLIDALRPRLDAEECSDAHRVMWGAAQAWYQLISGDIQQSLDGSLQVLSLAKTSGVHIFDHKLFGVAAQSSLLLGRLDEARAHLEKYSSVSPGGANLIQFHVQFLSGWERWASGDTAGANEHLKSAAQFLDMAGSPPIITAKLNIANALLNFEAGEEAEGRVCLDAATRIANITGSAWLQYNCFIIEADVAHNISLQKECLHNLRSALHVARINNLVVIDWWNAPMMSRLMEVALANQIESAYVQHIIKVMNLKPGALTFTSPAWPWPVSVELLGGFELKVAGEPATDSVTGQRKVMELLKALVTFGGTGISTTRLADSIWPDAEGDDARNALKTTVHRLRKVLVVHDAVQINEGMLSLNPEYCWSDVEAFRALSKTPKSSADRTGNLKKALGMYKGILLPEDDMPWVITQRKKLQRIEHEIVMELGSRYERRCRWNKAIRVYRQGLNYDSLDEQVCRHLMKCYQSSGREMDAVAVFEEYRDELERCVARRPSAKTIKLAESMLHS
jgi:LuxR family maltose regulon positive regulatory protein